MPANSTANSRRAPARASPRRAHAHALLRCTLLACATLPSRTADLGVTVVNAHADSTPPTAGLRAGGGRALAQCTATLRWRQARARRARVEADALVLDRQVRERRAPVRVLGARRGTLLLEVVAARHVARAARLRAVRHQARHVQRRAPHRVHRADAEPAPGDHLRDRVDVVVGRGLVQVRHRLRVGRAVAGVWFPARATR